jgi:hypothetical protein
VLLAGLSAVLVYFSIWRFYSEESASQGSSGIFLLIIVSSFLLTIISLPFLRTVFIRKQAIFNYAMLFEFAWTQCVCVLIAFLFSIVAALITMLSVSLFAVIGIDLSDLIYDPIILAPLLGAAFGLAIGVTRQSESIIHSTRHIMLALFRALLPVFMIITGIFLVTALIVGIDKLDTGFSVTLLLLISMTVSIIFCNGAVQDDESQLVGMINWVVRIQVLILPGFAALALYGLWMRMSEYGLTHSRLLAFTITGICSLYAVGYLYAGLSKSLVKKVQQVNIAAALATIAPCKQPGPSSV